MGILDNKSRIIDTVITEEGRRQLASGKMKIEYFSFTDTDVFYQSSSFGVASDATNRFCLESAPYMPQDAITPEADDSGLLVSIPRAINSNLTVFHDLVYSQPIQSSSFSGSLDVQPLFGDQFASQVTGLLSSSYDNFNDLMILRTRNNIFDDEYFLLSTGSINFDAKSLFNPSTTYLENVTSIISDKKFSNFANFFVLPPIQKLAKDEKYDSKKTYKPLLPNLTASIGNFSLQDAYNGQPTSINNYSFNGIKKTRQLGLSNTVNFLGSTYNKKLAFQVFESSENSIKKLDVLDLGVLDVKSGERILSVGKVLDKDPLNGGTFSFLQIFMIILK